jgi:uncharacterized membrane protein YccF (DUF307 family)
VLPMSLDRCVCGLYHLSRVLCTLCYLCLWTVVCVVFIICLVFCVPCVDIGNTGYTKHKTNDKDHTHNGPETSVTQGTQDTRQMIKTTHNGPETRCVCGLYHLSCVLCTLCYLCLWTVVCVVFIICLVFCVPCVTYVSGPLCVWSLSFVLCPHTQRSRDIGNTGYTKHETNDKDHTHNGPET